MHTAHTTHTRASPCILRPIPARVAPVLCPPTHKNHTRNTPCTNYFHCVTNTTHCANVLIRIGFYVHRVCSAVPCSVTCLLICCAGVYRTVFAPTIQTMLHRITGQPLHYLEFSMLDVLLILVCGLAVVCAAVCAVMLGARND